MKLNINADLGESFGPWPMGDDTQLLSVVNSANVACGFHAGDPLVMQTTLKIAFANNTSVGAHPGFPDLQGFGRRIMQLSENELYACVQYQLAAMDGICRTHGGKMTHVKPHGAMNNMACEDKNMATTIVKAIKDYDASQILLAPVLSELANAGEDAGLSVALEIFADRAYLNNGNLVPRSQSGAVLESANECITHVKSMIKNAGIVTQEGEVIKTNFHSVCVHGDNEHSVNTAKKLTNALIADGHELASLPSIFL